MTDISNNSFIEILRDYAAERKGELAFNMNEAADRLEEAEQNIARLRKQIDSPKWITDRAPTADEVEYAGDTGFILCISGTYDSLVYHHAIVMGDNFYEDDKWYIGGVGKSDTITLHGWMLPPAWEE